jgi:hypothetical protein
MTDTNASPASDPAYFVVLSGSYCSPEIAAEFGNLPPCFLPVGEGRLFRKQLTMAQSCNAQPVLSLPADYVLPRWDADMLAAQGVRIVRAPVSLTLNEAVQFVLEVLDAKGPLYMLYGDTLVEGDRLSELDQAAIQTTQSHYNWAEAQTDGDGKLKIISGFGDGVSQRSVLCGFFSFSDARELRQACVSSNSFDDSLMRYARARDLRPIEVREWHDFGHLSLVYQSRRNVMISRAFNRIWSDGVSVVKTSSKRHKIAAEAHWYEAIPESLRLYTPQYLGRVPENGGYRLEYLYLPTLAELYTFGELPTYVWRQILESCIGFLQDCWRHRPAPGTREADPDFAAEFFNHVFRNKTRERIAQFRADRGWAPDMPLSIDGRVFPPLEQVCERLLGYLVPTQPEDITLWHGDFFFGNILYDFRAARVHVIDPRGGYSDDDVSIYGDYRYDLSKLAHSIIGGYDSLLVGCVDFEHNSAGAFHFNRRWTQTQTQIAQVFSTLEVDGKRICTDEIRAMTALLFLTMLPLHADDPRRQDVMLCNGLVLAEDLFSKREA